MTVEAPEAPVSTPTDEQPQQPQDFVIDVDPHGGDEYAPPATDAADVAGAGAAVAVAGWTSAEAKQLYLACLNVWALPFGPEWFVSGAEAPADEQFQFLCPLLDRWLPKGTAGMAEMGVGLMMVAQGTVTIVVKRAPLIKRGPFAWMKDPRYGLAKPEPPPVRPPETPPAPPPMDAEPGDGSYSLPRDLARHVAPPPVDYVHGLDQVPGTGF